MSDSIETFEASRRRLLSIAYRMLGSMAEAEDIVQETWLRWHEARHDVLETPVAWLTTVTTRLAIDRLRRLRRERDAEGYWLPEPWLIDALPSAEDSVSRLCELSYGVLLLLERLSPDERAALLLYEVFDCSHDEIARIIGRKVEHCRQLVRRARERVKGPTRRPAPDGGAALAGAFVAAIHQQDKAAMIRLLAPGAVLIGDAAPTSITAGPSAMAGALLRTAAGMACTLVGINGGWGVLLRRGRIELALGIELDGEYIAAIYAIAPRRVTALA
jgi:RNA polymerase sigma factor (sigma-70 family)